MAIVAAALVVGFAVLVGVLTLLDWSENSKEPHATGRSDANIKVGGTATAVVATPRNVWLVDNALERVQRLDPTQNRVVGTVDLGVKPTGAFGSQATTALYASGKLWIALQDGTIVAVDDISPAVVGRIPTPAAGACCSMQLAGGFLWTATDSGTLRRINLDTGTVDASASLGTAAGAMAGTADALWVYEVSRHEVVRVDPATTLVTTHIRADGTLRALAADNDSLWITTQGDSHLRRLDAVTGRQEASIVVGPRAGAIAVATYGVLVASEGELGYISGDITGHTVSRIDPATNRITAAIRVINHPGAISIAPDGTVWVIASSDYPGWLSRVAPAGP